MSQRFETKEQAAGREISAAVGIAQRLLNERATSDHDGSEVGVGETANTQADRYEIPAFLRKGAD